jgi:hypothetical protein
MYSILNIIIVLKIAFILLTSRPGNIPTETDIQMVNMETEVQYPYEIVLIHDLSNEATKAGEPGSERSESGNVPSKWNGDLRVEIIL